MREFWVLVAKNSAPPEFGGETESLYVFTELAEAKGFVTDPGEWEHHDGLWSLWCGHDSYFVYHVKAEPC